MTGTALSADPQEYRRRLDERPDQQIDGWCVELLRDLSIRRGVLHVLASFRKAARLDEPGLERVYTAGGGPPATFGRTERGEVMVPAILLYCLVPGLRSQVKDARPRLTKFLVDSFDELVFI